MVEKQKHRSIIFYKDYFEDFFVKQRDKVKDKIIWTFDLIEELQRVPETYLKNIVDSEGLYEIRVQQGGDIFRIFCFFDHPRAISGFGKRISKEIPKNSKTGNKKGTENKGRL